MNNRVNENCFSSTTNNESSNDSCNYRLEDSDSIFKSYILDASREVISDALFS